MQLSYTNSSGKQIEFAIEGDKTVIGRSKEADLTLDSDRASRHHAEIVLWGGDYVLKDLHSRNGTFVNGERVEVSRLTPGDRIRIGGVDLLYGDPSPKAPNTVLRRIGEEMEEGKGYRTILRSIVDEATARPDTHRSDAGEPSDEGDEK